MDELQRANLRVAVPTRTPGANLETRLFPLELTRSRALNVAGESRVIWETSGAG